jgi:tetratricopeptide (TPR) repeat protein
MARLHQVWVGLLFVGLMGCPNTPDPPKEGPTKAELLAADGRAHMAQGDLEAAAALFEQARVTGRNEPHGRLGLATLALSQGELAAARRHLIGLRAVGIDPGLAGPWLTLFIDLQAESTPSSSVAPAGSGARLGTHTEAGPLTAEGGAFPDNTALIELFRNGRFQDIVLRLSSLPAPTLFQLRLLGTAYYRLEKYEQAVRALRSALLIDPRNVSVLQYLADSLTRLGRHQDAIRMYRILADMEPSDPGNWRLIGEAASASGDDEIALAAYSRAVENGLDNAEIRERIQTIRGRLVETEAP